MQERCCVVENYVQYPTRLDRNDDAALAESRSSPTAPLRSLGTVTV